MSTIDPPEGSRIAVKSDFDGTILSWKKPSGGPLRYFVSLFSIFWLGGWFFGFVSAVEQLLAGKGPVGFLAFWLGLWTLGGLFAVVLLFLLLRPQAPELLKPERDRFAYDTGSAPDGISSIPTG